MPVDRRVCFVCGSLGVESKLLIKPNDRREPYFPFLENHDPPKGARLPGKDGVVDSCRVCYAFLVSQWEAYERSRTPPIKRLYWLKRADNGHFTGAEMRLQGEYIAQVMGLQYHSMDMDEQTSPRTERTSSPPPTPQELRRSGGSRATPVAAASHRENRSQAKSQPSNDVNIVPHMPKKETDTAYDNGALDLSVTKKAESRKGSKLPDDMDGCNCFMCLRPCHISNSKLINTSRQSSGEPYFPVLRQVPQAKGSEAFNSLGQVRVCLSCKNVMYQQWQAYELSNVPINQRIYKLYDDAHPPKFFESSSGHDPLAVKEVSISSLSQSNTHVCYLCGHVYPEGFIQPICTVPSRNATIATLYFPFIRDLQRPQGALPLKSDGTVLTCRKCFTELYGQWHQHEMEKIPLNQRRYSLSFLSQVVPSGGVTSSLSRPSSSSSAALKQPAIKQESEMPLDKVGPSSASSSDISQPLNIQITDSIVSSRSPHVGLQGLLTIAQPSIQNVEVHVTSTSSPDLSGAAGGKMVTVPHPLEQATSVPKKVCFLCGESCKLTKIHILYSYPTRHETKAPNSCGIPFFPFLANREPAVGAESMSEEGTVFSCDFCYRSLMQQWIAYEDSPNPSDSNKWLRKYFLQELVCCYVCATAVKRKHFQTLCKSKFPFLVNHVVPKNALILDKGDMVGVCNACRQSLLHQFAEFERMGVPSEMRRYNWIQANEDPITEKNAIIKPADPKEEETLQQLNVDENTSDSNSSNVDVTGTKEDDEDGLGQGAKPPPLTMISPAGSKLSRNTATVPPLNQVSPSNGVTSVGANAALNATRTASFSAALRKLANQAKDPEEPSGKLSSSGGNSSPRAHTPKRGPPPLVYNNHSSSINSPPVVTIAPTQSHPTIVSSEGKQSVERSHSVQSASSSLYDSMKEKERPTSSHSMREEDRTAKELSNSRSRPHSGHNASSPAVSREEISRGFQPYRPGDDFRHLLPQPFGLDPTTAAAAATGYPYPFLPPHFSHPAFRMDDPGLLERYRMLQPSYFQFGPPGLLAPQMHPLLAGARYPSEFLHQQFPLGPRLPDHISPSLSERRLEEERIREIERDKEREREREREKEREALQREKDRVAREEYEREKSQELYYSQLHAEARNERGREREIIPDRLRIEAERLSHHKEELGAHRLASSLLLSASSRDHHSERREREKASIPPYSEHREVDRTARDRLAGDRRKDPETLQHRQEEKKPYSLLFSEKPGTTEKLSLRPSHSEQNFQASELSQKKGQDSSFFRPFDTQILSNGMAGSHSGDVDKYTREDTSKGLFLNKSHSGSELFSKRSHGGSNSGNSIPGQRSDDKVLKPFSPMKTFSREDYTKVTLQTRHADKSSGEPVRSNGDFKNQTQCGDTNHKASSLKGDKPLLKTNITNSSKTSHLPSSNKRRERKPKISRLDLCEQRLREKRQDPEYASDASDSGSVSDLEDSKIDRLMVIRNVMPLELDTSKEKMDFLANLGLTSQRVKKEMDFEKLRQRRRFHREHSVSPAPSNVKDILECQSRLSPLAVPGPHSESLCLEADYPKKCAFLSSMELNSLSPEKKKAELSTIRKVCEEEKVKRLGCSSSLIGEKRKAPESPVRQCSSTKYRQTLHDPSSSASSIPSDSVDRTNCIPGSSSSVNISRNNNKVTSHSDKLTSLFPHRGDKSVSLEFAQEFHESVLQSTKQKELHIRTGHSRTLEPSGYSRNGPSVTSELQDGSSFYRWPGIEVLMESYQHHLYEQYMERSYLMERCQHLQEDNQALQRTAESLDRRYLDLSESRNRLNQSRTSTEQAIKSLKSRVRDLR